MIYEILCWLPSSQWGRHCPPHLTGMEVWRTESSQRPDWPIWALGGVKESLSQRYRQLAEPGPWQSQTAVGKGEEVVWQSGLRADLHGQACPVPLVGRPSLYSWEAFLSNEKKRRERKQGGRCSRWREPWCKGPEA